MILAAGSAARFQRPFNLRGRPSLLFIPTTVRLTVVAPEWRREKTAGAPAHRDLEEKVARRKQASHARIARWIDSEAFARIPDLPKSRAEGLVDAERNEATHSAGPDNVIAVQRGSAGFHGATGPA